MRRAGSNGALPRQPSLPSRSEAAQQTLPLTPQMGDAAPGDRTESARYETCSRESTRGTLAERFGRLLGIPAGRRRGGVAQIAGYFL